MWFPGFCRRCLANLKIKKACDGTASLLGKPYRFIHAIALGPYLKSSPPPRAVAEYIFHNFFLTKIGFREKEARAASFFRKFLF
jgi:hypothetical protein